MPYLRKFLINPIMFLCLGVLLTPAHAQEDKPLLDRNLMEGVNSSIEFGFADFGFDDDDTGIWASYVVDATITGKLGWLAQAGLDIGDDSGLLVGAGIKAMLNEKSDLRFEYIKRDEVDSLQINFLYHL